MKVNFAHVCDYSSISREGKLHINGVFHAIFAPSVPVTHPLMHFAFELECAPAELGREFRLEIQMVTQDGRRIIDLGANPTIPVTGQISGPLFIAQSLAFSGTEFPEFGDYSFNIFVNGDLKHSTPFAVVKLPIQASPGKPPAQGLPK